MSPLTITALAVYAAGAAGTFAYNMYDMVYVTRPLAIARNAIFWPVFLPILLIVGKEN